jgi:hypothetical protein
VKNLIVLKVLRWPWFDHYTHCIVEYHAKNCVDANDQVDNILNWGFLYRREGIDVKVGQGDQ